MPDPAKILPTIRRAATLIRATRGRSGGLVEPPPDTIDDVLVVGDLHGHLEVFAEALRLAALEANPRRHLIVQELVHDNRINPDEGQIDRSHRLIDLVCAVIAKYPHRVHYLLGNHELSELTGRSISKQGFALNQLFAAGVAADYPAQVDDFLAAYRDLFASLPLAVRLPNRIFVCHTIPDPRDLESFDPKVYAATSWSDAMTRRGGPVYALTWGRDTSDANADRFAALVEADLFLCGHQPCDEGYRRANRRVLILDGTDPQPTCCLVPARQPLTLDELCAAVRPIHPIG
ncbi:MAG: hypothetical protein KatS3mg108_1156 [Isosphaeraceae bacterium]|jgi:hypothetical protein|nr:MAG: hypothetical protein KatS3mg108_1156 [Isosphaeraceae bacterium]